MKINKISLALATLGLVSLGSVAQANTTVYLTGSTAIRAFIFSASTATANGIFVGGASIVSPTPNNTSAANNIVFEGTMTGITGTVDLNCSFTGSEVGIAAVANNPQSQTLFQAYDPNAAAGGTAYALPGSTPLFLTAASSYGTAATLTGGQLPDLTMADTSQAVSRTPNTGSFALVDYGIVGVVPFTWMKGYELAANVDQAYNDLVNVTTPELNQALANGFLLDANIFTGVAADASDGVAVFGRNFGSGTRANEFLNSSQTSLAPNVSVQQYAYGTPANLYPAGANAGILQFGTANYDGEGLLNPVGNDGFDSGSGVQKEMNTDGSDNFVVPLGYLALSDAQNALGVGSSPFVQSAHPLGGIPIVLPFNGVYESDANVINGNYTFWGSEHILGQHGQTGNGAAAGADIFAGIHAYLVHNGAGTVGGNLSTTPLQSPLIPTELMEVNRGKADSGYPTQDPSSSPGVITPGVGF